MVEATRAPKAPAAASAPVSEKQAAEFEQMKRNLNQIASWELIGNSWDKLAMAFTESGNEAQAKTLLAILE